MIRNVVLGRARADADEREIDAGLAGIAALRLPGLLSTVVGRDIGVRPGGWTFAITNDWADEAAYRGYDLDPEHNGFRDRIAAQCDEIARVQLSVD